MGSASTRWTRPGLRPTMAASCQAWPLQGSKNAHQLSLAGKWLRRQWCQAGRPPYSHSQHSGCGDRQWGRDTPEKN